MNKQIVRISYLAALLLTLTSIAAAGSQASADPRLHKAYRFQQGGWTYVHLEGSPSDIGFQHEIGRAHV